MKQYLIILFLIISFFSFSESEKNIKIGKETGEISFSPHNSEACFSTDKYDNIYIYDYYSKDIKVFSFQGKYLKSWKYDDYIDITDLRVSYNNNIMVVGYNGIIVSNNILLLEITAHTKLISKFRKYNSYILSENGVVVFSEDGEIALFDIFGNDIKNIGNNNLYIEGNLKINPNFKILQDSRGLKSDSYNDYLNFDHEGYTYWGNRGDENQYIKIYDNNGVKIKQLSFPVLKNNDMLESIRIGYWGDIIIERVVGEYIEPDYDGNPGKRPTAYSFEKIPNTWSYVKGHYFAEIAKVGLSNKNNDEIVTFIKSLEKSELRIFRNTLFALKGLNFKSEDLVKYYHNFEWYIPNAAIIGSKDILDKGQQELFDLILSYENK